MIKFFQIFTIFLLIIIQTTSLKAIEKSEIPESLKKWEKWVLDDVKDKDCPISYESKKTICSYPSQIDINLDKNNLTFTLFITTFKDNEKIFLPSSYQKWIKSILVNGQKKALLGSKKAFIILNKGSHKVEGIINWKKKQKYLQLPKNIALVNLYKNGVKVFPLNIDQNSKLWFEQKNDSKEKKGSVSVSIYRKLIDGHPLKMKTHLHFRVSGKMRTIILDGITLKDFYPSGLTGKLDSRITEDKKLEVEIKAGEWTVNVDSFSSKNISKFQIPNYKFKYANQETLSVENNSDYRTIEIEGARSIDPNQTNIPNKWKSLPLFLTPNNKIFKVKELYKSNKQQQQNDLTLKRKIWLDFDGKGYSVEDNITAKIAKVRRLEATNILNLGSVSINSKPTLISKLKNSQQKGIELREKNLNIKASSRYEGNISLLPTNGWDEPFNSVNTELNLPPGWKLLAAFGSDGESRAWLDKWNLMDIFLLLLLSITIYKLFGLKWSIPATFFLILLWHENSAPTIIWLWVALLVTLLHVINTGKINYILKLILGFSSAFVILNILQFSVSEIRTALYPQLERPSISKKSSFKPIAIMDKENSYKQTEKYSRAIKSIAGASIKRKKISREVDYQQNIIEQKQQILLQNKIDPNAIVQTGEGTPTWKWSKHYFYWQSAVGNNDKLKLWLINPTMSKFLNIFRVIGMIFLFFMFFKDFYKPSMKGIKGKSVLSKSIKIIFLATFLSVLTNQTAKANTIPSDQLLKQLKNKLLKDPVCLPECASINTVDIKIVDDILTINLSVSAGTKLSVPILGNKNIWLPQNVSVNNGKSNLQLDKDGDLWVMLTKGVNKVSLSGSVKSLERIMFSPRLRLNNLTIKQGDLWRINSDNKSYIELVNLDKKLNQKREKTQSSIEPMIEIKRTFYFGLRWYIETDVKLLNRIDKPYTFTYDLLDDESILNKEMEVKNKKAILHLRKSKSSYHWRSSLPITNQLSLKASKQNQVTEVWQMDISSIWRMTHKGLDEEKQLNIGNQLKPVFRPWKNEVLNLNLEKVKAVKGKSLTIESSNLDIVQSQRYRDLTLKLKIQSSKAGQYTIKLSNAKKLKSVTIDSKTHYLKISNKEVALPLKAKAQEIIIKWREELSTNTKYNFGDINLGQNSVNSNINLKLPRNRWVLWTRGTILGPAVLLWGVLLALLLFAIILGRIEKSPLKTKDWLFLGIGLSTTSIIIMLPIVIWIFSLMYREEKGNSIQGQKRNAIQVLLILLTIIALGTIVSAVSVGLLGSPNMMVQGNNSYTYNLNWYSDRIGDVLIKPTVITVSIWYYRVLMLIWSIWISFSLIKWLKWAWTIFSQGNIWVKKEKKKKQSKEDKLEK